MTCRAQLVQQEHAHTTGTEGSPACDVGLTVPSLLPLPAGSSGSGSGGGAAAARAAASLRRLTVSCMRPAAVRRRASRGACALSAHSQTMIEWLLAGAGTGKLAAWQACWT